MIVGAGDEEKENRKRWTGSEQQFGCHMLSSMLWPLSCTCRIGCDDRSISIPRLGTDPALRWTG